MWGTMSTRKGDFIYVEKQSATDAEIEALENEDFDFGETLNYSMTCRTCNCSAVTYCDVMSYQSSDPSREVKCF